MPVREGTLGIYMFIRNADYYDYPWRESLLSALPVADQIVVCECYSDKDETATELFKFSEKHPGRIEIIHNDWVTDFRQLSQLGNYCVPFLRTEWAWQLQADEVIHEASYNEIKHLKMYTPKEISAAKVHYRHLVANYETEFDFMYRELVRIARKGRGWWLKGDACQLEDGDMATVIDTGIQVLHYGKVHAGKVAWQKEWDFQQLFTDVGFPDPKMKEMEQKLGEQFCDYLYLFEEAVKRGEFRKFTGTHPGVMHDRIAAAKLGGWEQFQSRMKEGLALK